MVRGIGSTRGVAAITDKSCLCF